MDSKDPVEVASALRSVGVRKFILTMRSDWSYDIDVEFTPTIAPRVQLPPEDARELLFAHEHV